MFTAFKLKQDLHIFQLNSYRVNRYLRWMSKKIPIAFRAKNLIGIISIPLLFLKNPIFAGVFFISFYSLSFVFRPQFQEKKPLVFTSRAKRLYFLSLLLLCVLYIVLFLFLWRINILHLVLLLSSLILVNFLSPFWLILSNVLILPLENTINRYYFNDAKKKLESIPGIKKIGITGSFGKTTTKYALNEILRHKYNTLMTPGSFNTPMGISKVIRSHLNPTCEVFIAEMSAKEVGDIRELCELVNPQIGLLTSIGEQHLETFGSIENIKNTKNELILSLPPDGLAFFNMDDKCCRELAPLSKSHNVYYGIDSEDVNYMAKDIVVNSKGSSFVVCKNKDGSIDEASFQTKLLGRHNVYNILAAISVASELGVELKDMVHSIRSLNQVPHRLELKTRSDNVMVIDDAFNSNPVGSKMALDLLASVKDRRKIIVTPGMIDLGEREYSLNMQFGEYMASVCDIVILVGKKQTLAIQEGLKNKKFPLERCYVAEDFYDANSYLRTISHSNDVVLFENDLPDNYREN